MENMKSKIGFTDEAATEDLFGITNYIDGLVQFIENCETPMTISIQGSWGTGKTTVMNIVREALQRDGMVRDIWFNTWQFSQFQFDQSLAISFLECLCDELELSEEKKKEFSKLMIGLRKAGQISKEALLSFADGQIGERFANNLERVFDAAGGKKDYESPMDALKSLREKFGKYIAESLSVQAKEKVVVFVDDLDRLEPRKAVELLEVMKLFFDSTGCVFVLAIDYDVVIRGVKDKYGFDEKDEEKGRCFFDKIIQLPFKLPVTNYQITKYVEQCLGRIGISLGEEEVTLYTDLIEKSIGSNPRSMKRLFNAFLLMQYTVSKELWRKHEERNLLFGMLCIQYSDDDLYNTLVSNLEDPSMLDGLRSFDVDKEEVSLLVSSLNEDTVEKWKDFMQIFWELIQNGLSSDADMMSRLRKVAAVTSITVQSDPKMNKNNETPGLTYDVEGEKTLNKTDLNYRIITLGKEFHIGYDKPVTVEYEGRRYQGKMHKTGKGRIDRMSDFYNENHMEIGENLHVKYDSANARIILKKM